MSAQPSNSANGAMLTPGPSTAETATGLFIDLRDPDPVNLSIADIATALGNICRYGGHVHQFYSVAEHAVLVHDLMRSQGADHAALNGALFHDATEAYLGDLVAPLKWALRMEEGEQFDEYAFAEADRAIDSSDYRSRYDVLTSRMEYALVRAYGTMGVTVDAMNSAALRVADMWALRIEAKALTRSGGAHWRWPGELPNDGELPDSVCWAGGLLPMDAAGLWVDRVDELWGPGV